MTPMRRTVMIGAVAALLAAGAAGCNERGEVTAPGPGPAVEEPSESGPSEASDGGGENETIGEYGIDKETMDDLLEDGDEADEMVADLFKVAPKVLERIK